MKKIHVTLIITFILVLDQVLKFYIKTNYNLNTSKPILGNWFQFYFVEKVITKWNRAISSAQDKTHPSLDSCAWLLITAKHPNVGINS